MDIITSPRRRGGKKSHKGRQANHHASTGKYARQALRTATNKAKARKAHLEANPNDLQAQQALSH